MNNWWRVCSMTKRSISRQPVLICLSSWVKLRRLFCCRWSRAVGWRTRATATRAKRCRYSTDWTWTATIRPTRRSWQSSVSTSSSERHSSRAGSESGPRSGCCLRSPTPRWQPRFGLSYMIQSSWHTHAELRRRFFLPILSVSAFYSATEISTNISKEAVSEGAVNDASKTLRCG